MISLMTPSSISGTRGFPIDQNDHGLYMIGCSFLRLSWLVVAPKEESAPLGVYNDCARVIVLGRWFLCGAREVFLFRWFVGFVPMCMPGMCCSPNRVAYVIQITALLDGITRDEIGCTSLCTLN